MALVNAKCTACGANLEVDGTQDAAICKYCGAAFIVEKAVNNYNIENNIANAQINIQTVNVHANNSSDFKIINGELLKYCGNDKNVIIPDNVFLIKAGAFSGNRQITSIVIPDTVTEIENHRLKMIRSSEADGHSELIAFYEDGMYDNKEQIITPFSDCQNLEEIILSKNISSLDVNTFWGCKKLSKIVIKGSIQLNPCIEYSYYGRSQIYHKEYWEKWDANKDRKSIVVLPNDIDTKDYEIAPSVVYFFEIINREKNRNLFMNGVDITQKLELLKEVKYVMPEDERIRREEENRKSRIFDNTLRTIGITLLSIWLIMLIDGFASGIFDMPSAFYIVFGIIGVAGFAFTKFGFDW